MTKFTFSHDYVESAGKKIPRDSKLLIFSCDERMIPNNVLSETEHVFIIIVDTVISIIKYSLFLRTSIDALSRFKVSSIFGFRVDAKLINVWFCTLTLCGAKALTYSNKIVFLSQNSLFKSNKYLYAKIVAAFVAKMGPQTRYTLRRNTTSFMNDLI